MKNKVNLEELEMDWKAMLDTQRSLFREGGNYFLFWHDPARGYLNISQGKEILEEGITFPNVDDYSYGEYSLYMEDHKILDVIRQAFDGETYDLHYKNVLMIDEFIGNSAFNEQVIKLTFKWTVEYFREIGTTTKFLFYTDADKLLELTTTI